MLDLALVKIVYFIFGLFIYSVYPALSALNWWFYLILALLCAMPLQIHVWSQSGGLLDKMHAYLKTNNPSNQVLLAMSMFFFAAMVAVLVPVLAGFSWWIYVVAMIVFAIKPMTVTWFW